MELVERDVHAEIFNWEIGESFRDPVVGQIFGWGSLGFDPAVGGGSGSCWKFLLEPFRCPQRFGIEAERVRPSDDTAAGAFLLAGVICCASNAIWLTDIAGVVVGIGCSSQPCAELLDGCRIEWDLEEEPEMRVAW